MNNMVWKQVEKNVGSTLVHSFVVKRKIQMKYCKRISHVRNECMASFRLIRFHMKGVYSVSLPYPMKVRKNWLNKFFFIKSALIVGVFLENFSENIFL